MQAQGWGPQGVSGVHLTNSSAAKGSLIYLRPDDIFQIGNATLELQREASEKPANPEVQVTSSGCDAVIVAEISDSQYDVKMKPFQDYQITSQPVSTPGLPHSIDKTIMETPTTSRHHELDVNGSPIKLAAVHERLKDDEDENKTRESDKMTAKLALIDRAKGMKENCYTNDELMSIPPRTKVDQEHNLHSAVGDQVAQPSLHEEDITIANAKDSVKSFVDIQTLQTSPTTGSSSKSRKRKRAEDASEDNKTTMIHDEVSSSGTRTKATKQQKLAEQPNEVNKKTQTSPHEPTSSNKSIESEHHEKHKLLPSSNEMRVFFASSTSVSKTSKSMGFLKKQGIVNAKSVTDCDVLCIGNGDLKKTCNLVLAVMSGKQVINEDWVAQSFAKGELLDQNDFLARDPSKEAEWGTDLDEAIERGRQGVKPFLDFTLYFTSAAKKELGKGFSELKDIALHAGASSVQTTLPRKSDLLDAPKTIIISAQNDGDLSGLEKGGWKTFKKDIVTLSALRGALDMDSDEFLVRNGASAAGGTGKRRKR